MVSSDSAIAALVNDFAEKNNNDLQKAIGFEKALNSIRYEVVSGKAEGFSNGEDVKIKVTYDETLMKEVNIRVENTEFDYTVSGLQEAKEIDLFAEIEVVFHGISPYATARVSKNSEQGLIRDINYTIEPNEKLRIGDVVVVTATVSEEKLERHGYIMSDTISKEFVVEGVDKYITDFSEVSQEALDRMKREAVETVEKECTNEYSNLIKELRGAGIFDFAFEGVARDVMISATFDLPELTNMYFFVLEPGVSRGNWDNINNIFLFYKVTAHMDTDEAMTRTAYTAVRFANAVLKTDGSIEATLSETSAFHNAAAKSIDELYRYILSREKEIYEIQEIQP